ncbi:hypothetical protein F444_21281 [Phytophthora nicotianae P1976]|uniref:Uncharacterized protein n=1 Tax=Phytophthora nicotianae P1976 TaxID=1317066 RepID=A0A080Z1N2_PHYNI|nr:hypothetical protein F444_21281 [Phytophthora nicotianae P1976]
MLVNTFSRALQRLSDSAGTPTRTPQPAEARPVSRPVPASSGNAFVDRTRPVSTPMLGYQGSMAPRMALPAPASTPVGMPMAAIPSYGGVTIQAPNTSRNDGGDGAARLGALYPPFQPPITPTAGWSSSGMLPAWSAAPATQTPASAGGLGLGRSFGGPEGGYSMHSAYPQSPMVSRTLGHGGDYAARDIGTQPRRNEPIVGNGTPRRGPRLGNKDNGTSKTGTERRQRSYGTLRGRVEAPGGI